MGALERVTAIDARYWKGETISVEEVSFLFDCLESDSAHVAAKSAICLTAMDDDVVNELVTRFPDYPESVKMVLVGPFCALDTYEAYKQLFLILKHDSDGPLVQMTIASLAQTEYPLIHLVIQAFSEYMPMFTSRVKRVLTLAGFNRYKQSLLMFPQIPFEREFREVFGADSIDRIKSV